MRLENDKQNEQYLYAFYEGILKPAFPSPDHLESFDSLVDQLKRADDNQNFDCDFRVYVDSDAITGGAIYCYFPKANAGVIEHVAVNQSVRRQGYGQDIVWDIIAILELRARQCGYKHLDHLFIEVEQNRPDSAFTFWKLLGFKIIALPYQQPELHIGHGPVEDEYLAVWSHEDLSDRSINRKDVKSFLKEYFLYSFNLPEERAELWRPYTKMELFMDTHPEEIPLMPFPG